MIQYINTIRDQNISDKYALQFENNSRSYYNKAEQNTNYIIFLTLNDCNDKFVECIIFSSSESYSLHKNYIPYLENDFFLLHIKYKLTIRTFLHQSRTQQFEHFLSSQPCACLMYPWQALVSLETNKILGLSILMGVAMAGHWSSYDYEWLV